MSFSPRKTLELSENKGSRGKEKPHTPLSEKNLGTHNVHEMKGKKRDVRYRELKSVRMFTDLITTHIMYSIVYYSDKVFDDISQWPVGIAANYERVTDLIRTNGPNLGMPYTKAMGDGLFEIRAKGAEGIGRAFFCTIVGQKVVILHSFIKKTQQTPQKELKLARQRLKEVKSNV